MAGGTLTFAEIAVELRLHANDLAHSIEDAQALALTMQHAPGVLYAVEQMRVRHQALVEAHEHFKDLAARDTAQVVVLAEVMKAAGSVA